MATWMQVKFEDVKWYCERVSRSGSLGVDPTAKTNAMAVGFLASKIVGDKKPIGDLLSCLVKSSHVTMVNTIGRSKYLGPGSRRCSFLLPKSIIIPTDIKVPIGITEIPTMSQEIKVSGERYYMTFSIKVRSAVMSTEDADTLYATRPKEFIGYIDCATVPEGALSESETKSGGTLKST